MDRREDAGEVYPGGGFAPTGGGARPDAIAELAKEVKDLESGVETLGNEVENKVEKEAGKGLSTNDYTTAEKEKLAACKTKAELDAGWWSEWVCDPATYEGEPVSVRRIKFGETWFFQPYLGDISLTDESVIEDEGQTELSWDRGQIGNFNLTATRHRVAAPVPTKPEDIGAQPAGNYLTQHQQLTPVYSQTPTFSEWVYSDESAAVEIVGQPTFSIDPNDGSPYWTVPILLSGEATTVSLGGSFDATVLQVIDDGDDSNISFTATRTRTDIIGYTLGNQTTKPLQPQGYYATTAQLALKAAPYPFAAPTWSVDNGTNVCILAPFANSQLDLTAQVNAGYTAFTVLVSAAPVTDTMRDLWFVVKSGDDAPTITWPANFVPANDDADNLVAEASATTVFLISEYAPSKFLVARQVVEDAQ